MTHRVFSRNASSSRAIPVQKQLDMIISEPAMPLEFRLNQKGMQAGEALSPENQKKAEEIWLKARDAALGYCNELAALGVHKQYANRLVEPFAHISVVCSATEFANFFALRHHSMAQPEIAELARQMWDIYPGSKPKSLKAGDWHLPFITEEEIKAAYDPGGSIVRDGVSYDVMVEPWTDWTKLIKMSVARCARVSYLKHDGTQSSYEEDCALYDRLLAEQPIHASPAEHQARALAPRQGILVWSGNFRGWEQYRKMIPNENITTFEGPLG
jgi:thymidylate synthase ThyX